MKLFSEKDVLDAFAGAPDVEYKPLTAPHNADALEWTQKLAKMLAPFDVNVASVLDVTPDVRHVFEVELLNLVKRFPIGPFSIMMLSCKQQDAYATTLYRFGDVIVFNQEIWNEPGRAAALMRDDFEKTRFHQTPCVGHVLWHEYGHILRKRLLNDEPGITALDVTARHTLGNSDFDRLINAAVSKLLHQLDSDAAVSRYAYADPEEWFAETFSAIRYWEGQEHRDVTAIKKIIADQYAHLRQSGRAPEWLKMAA